MRSIEHFLSARNVMILLLIVPLLYFLHQNTGVEGFSDSRLADCTCPFQCSSFCPRAEPESSPMSTKTCTKTDLCPRVLTTNRDRAAFTDKDCLSDTLSAEVESPYGSVMTFNADESPLEHAYIRGDENTFVSQPKVINNTQRNLIPPYMVSQVALARRSDDEGNDPVPENALVKENPSNFTSEKTNLASFFQRNTNLMFRDQQQFPIDQLAWNDKMDCFNNIMYHIDLTPKEHFIVNKI